MAFKIKYTEKDAVKFVRKSKEVVTVATIKQHYGCSDNTARFLFNAVACQARAGKISVQYMAKEGRNPERVIAIHGNKNCKHTCCLYHNVCRQYEANWCVYIMDMMEIPKPEWYPAKVIS